MGKAKKPEKDKGASKKGVKPASVTPSHEESKDADAGIIGIGMPMTKEELQRLKEDAKKLDK